MLAILDDQPMDSRGDGTSRCISEKGFLNPERNQAQFLSFSVVPQFLSGNANFSYFT